MSHKSQYVTGDWLTNCDSCGATRLSSELRKRWDGLMVDSRCWESRHPQDFVRGVTDTQVPPWTRPEPQDTFLVVCTPMTRSCQADFGTADCMQVGFVLDLDDYIGTHCTPIGRSSICNYAVADCAICDTNI